MQAITTKYLNPTNTKGARIKAMCARGAITIDYPHELTGHWAHLEAVSALVKRFIAEDQKQYGTPPDGNPWARAYCTGQLPNGNYAHVFVS